MKLCKVPLRTHAEGGQVDPVLGSRAGPIQVEMLLRP